MRCAVALLLGLSACTPAAVPTVPPHGDPRLLATLFEDARSIESQLAVDFACVSVRHGGQDSDPPTVVVEALAERWSVPVVPGSRCSIGGDGDVVAAPGVGGSGKWLRVVDLACGDSNRCTADVSYYVANMGSGGRSVSVERTGAGWRVTPTGRMWIS